MNPEFKKVETLKGCNKAYMFEVKCSDSIVAMNEDENEMIKILCRIGYAVHYNELDLYYFDGYYIALYK